MTTRFSYFEYQQIVEFLRSRLPIMDFSAINTESSKYCVIRHDVEFSVDRAVKLARFEAQSLGVESSYLFQLRNNCYNLISETNIQKLHEILSLGHHVGLHYHMDASSDVHEIEDSILKEAELFQALTGIKVDRFSFHRPPQSVLKQYLQVEGLINCYDKPFFHYYESPHNQLDVKYFTDSRHEWHHGYPLGGLNQKVQLLTHPYSWSERGADNVKNYQILLEEKSIELRQSINRETSTFPPELLQ
jgi:hypothetical protein